MIFIRIRAGRLGAISLPPFGWLLARLGELGELGLLPLAAALDEDAFEEEGSGFGVGVLCPPVLGEFALDRRLKDGGTITLQVGSHPLQGGDPGIEVGKKLFDLGDDAALLWQRCKPKTQALNMISAKVDLMLEPDARSET